MDVPHTAPDLTRFLDGERAQVWARHRETGESFYLPVGEAEQHRAFAKSHLRCPYPGCDVPISTKGRSKRDHFFHVNGTPHESAGESEFHLAGKAMIVAWAATRVPEGAVVREEETVKDEAAFVHRRADVMATGRSGRQVAYEIEYKAFAVEAWQAKQADYDGQGIACAWLLGHTRVSLARWTEHLEGHGVNLVALPLLAVEIVKAGKPLVVVNPVTRQVGTLMGDAAGTTHFQGRYDNTAWLAVDDLDDCTFEARRGIVTPTMRAIDVHEARRAEQERLAAEEATRAAVNVARIEANHERAWLASPVRAALVERWGSVPAVLEADYGNRWSFHALPAHWHGVLYEELLHGRTAGVDFKWADVFAALDRHQIVRAKDSGKVFQGLALFMEAMAERGLVAIYREANRRIRWFATTGVPLDVGVAEYERRKEAEAARVRAVGRAYRSGSRAEQDALRAKTRLAEIEARSLTKRVVREDGTVTYVRK